MDYIEYLKKELEKTERRLHYASNKSGVKKEEIKNLKEKANMLSNCIKFICKFSGSEVKPLSWLDLQSRKSKPVYIKEKQRQRGHAAGGQYRTACRRPGFRAAGTSHSGGYENRDVLRIGGKILFHGACRSGGHQT